LGSQPSSRAVSSGSPDWAITTAGWADAAGAISNVRRQVFVIEQRVAEYEEWDAADQGAVHVLVLDEKRDAVGTGRLEPSGKVGRIAVVLRHRATGIGVRIIERLLAEARALAMEEVYLNAQTQAQGFYTHLGFRPVGATFMEAGIEHVRMELRLESESNAQR
jgi:predicted GNAT family N-acyltransferase